jgi:hypothetical protein
MNLQVIATVEGSSTLIALEFFGSIMNFLMLRPILFCFEILLANHAFKVLCNFMFFLMKKHRVLSSELFSANGTFNCISAFMSHNMSLQNSSFLEGLIASVLTAFVISYVGMYNGVVPQAASCLERLATNFAIKSSHFNVNQLMRQ